MFNGIIFNTGIVQDILKRKNSYEIALKTKISFKKKTNGNPLFKERSISWTLLLSEKMETINIRISDDVLISCFRIYFSINFIDI